MKCDKGTAGCSKTGPHTICWVPIGSNSPKQEIEALVGRHGLRRVCEELVEVAWDLAEDSGNAEWRQTAAKLGNAVHWNKLKQRQAAEWPS